MPEKMISSSNASETCQWVIEPEPEIEDLVPTFLRNRFNELAVMEIAADRGDDEEIRRLAHLWKGVCRPYGFIDLEGLSRELEEAARANDRTRVSDLLKHIKFCLQNARIVTRQHDSSSDAEI